MGIFKVNKKTFVYSNEGRFSLRTFDIGLNQTLYDTKQRYFLCPDEHGVVRVEADQSYVIKSVFSFDGSNQGTKRLREEDGKADKHENQESVPKKRNNPFMKFAANYRAEHGRCSPAEITEHWKKLDNETKRERYGMAASGTNKPTEAKQEDNVKKENNKGTNQTNTQIKESLTKKKNNNNFEDTSQSKKDHSEPIKKLQSDISKKEDTKTKETKKQETIGNTKSIISSSTSVDIDRLINNQKQTVTKNTSKKETTPSKATLTKKKNPNEELDSLSDLFGDDSDTD